MEANETSAPEEDLVMHSWDPRDHDCIRSSLTDREDAALTNLITDLVPLAQPTPFPFLQPEYQTVTVLLLSWLTQSHLPFLLPGVRTSTSGPHTAQVTIWILPHCNYHLCLEKTLHSQGSSALFEYSNIQMLQFKLIPHSGNITTNKGTNYKLN